MVLISICVCLPADVELVSDYRGWLHDSTALDIKGLHSFWLSSPRLAGNYVGKTVYVTLKFMRQLVLVQLIGHSSAPAECWFSCWSSSF
jgi:hypothetical protein